ncbi:MAG: DNA polymerase III subunit delta [Solirubrobacteraceae bacterium]
MPPTFKPAYLIHGDDHGRIAERRARLRSLAESISGPEGLELIEGEEATPDRAAAALDAMTLALGRRFIIVDGAEQWKDKDLDALVASLAAMPPETTITFFAREEGRATAPERLHKAVRKAKGDISAEVSVKSWELPKWVVAQAAALGIELDTEGARALVRHVGDRQQRLLRELEKLALGAGPEGAALDAAEVEELTASSAERRAWIVADALVAGDARAAVSLYLKLRAQGERLPGLLYWISQRVRAAHEVAVALDVGEPPAQIKRGMRMPSKAADRLIADARRAGSEQLARATWEIADLELASRGGASGGATEDTAALVAFGRITGETISDD